MPIDTEDVGHVATSWNDKSTAVFYNIWNNQERNQEINNLIKLTIQICIAIKMSN